MCYVTSRVIYGLALTMFWSISGPLQARSGNGAPRSSLDRVRLEREVLQAVRGRAQGHFLQPIFCI